MSDTKYCKYCDQHKLTSEFSKHKTTKDRLHTGCKDCHNKRNRRNRLVRVYGITEEAYAAMSTQQRGKCAICAEPPEPGKRLYVDHNHLTGEVRALLCNNCNVALGLFKEREATLLAAVNYIKRYN